MTRCRACKAAIRKAEGFQPSYEAALGAELARCPKHKKEAAAHKTETRRKSP